MSTNEPSPSPWAPPQSPPDPGTGNAPGPPPQFSQPHLSARPPGAWPFPAAAPGGAPPPQTSTPPPAHSPTPPPAPPSGSRSRFGIGLLVGALIGLLVGGIIGGAIGLLVGDSAPTSIYDDGSGFVPVGPDEPSTFGTNDAAPPSVATSRADPAPVGTVISIGNGWDVAVDGFEPDADQIVIDDEFDEAPPDGQQFVLVSISATYVGGEEESQSPFFGMDLALVGADGVERTEFDSPCSAPEPTFDRSSELYAGASATGQLCFSVGENEVDSLVFVVTPSMAFDPTKSFMALT